jgi:hypothetical protein
MRQSKKDNRSGAMPKKKPKNSLKKLRRSTISLKKKRLKKLSSIARMLRRRVNN